MLKHYLKLSYTEYDPVILSDLTFLGYLDELMPIKELRAQIKTLGWAVLFTQVAEQLKEEGVIDFFLVVETETKRVQIHEKDDILKIIEGNDT